MENERNLTDNQQKLKDAASPLIKYLCENWHPHVTAIVTPTGVELLSSDLTVQNIHEFIVED